MSAWTNGPWTLGNEDNSCCDVDTGKTTITLDRHDPNSGVPIIEREEMLANAHLVAAAPDLYEALEGFCFAVSLRYGAYDGTDDQAAATVEMAHGGLVAQGYLNARRILAKARGEAS